MRAILRRLRARSLAPLSVQLSATDERLAADERRRAETLAALEAQLGAVEAAIGAMAQRIEEHATAATAMFDARIGGIEAAVSRIEHRIDERMDISDHRAEGLLQLSAAFAEDAGRALERLERDLLLSRDTVLELAAHVARELGDLREAPVTGEPR